MACARCHDHKFDPITQQDYYALAGVFASTRQVDLPLLPPTPTPGSRSGTRQARSKQSCKQLKVKKVRRSRREEDRGADGRSRAAQEDDAGLRRAGGAASRRPACTSWPTARTSTKLEYKPGAAQDVAVQIRGNPTNLGPVVPRRFLAVLSPERRSRSRRAAAGSNWRGPSSTEARRWRRG